MRQMAVSFPLKCHVAPGTVQGAKSRIRKHAPCPSGVNKVTSGWHCTHKEGRSLKALANAGSWLTWTSWLRSPPRQGMLPQGQDQERGGQLHNGTDLLGKRDGHTHISLLTKLYSTRRWKDLPQEKYFISRFILQQTTPPVFPLWLFISITLLPHRVTKGPLYPCKRMAGTPRVHGSICLPH